MLYRGEFGVEKRNEKIKTVRFENESWWNMRFPFKKAYNVSRKNVVQIEVLAPEASYYISFHQEDKLKNKTVEGWWNFTERGSYQFMFQIFHLQAQTLDCF